MEAQRRAAQRGLEDTEGDVKTKEHFEHTDLAQALKNLGTSYYRGQHDILQKAGRGREDIQREADRGGEKLSTREGDLHKEGARQNEDFDRQLADIGRRFRNLGRSQGEAANAAGVLDAGTLAAGAAARTTNQRLAEEPIGVARQRTNEDLATVLGRLGISRSQLGEDTGRELGRIGEDTKTSLGRLLEESKRKGGEAEREAGRGEFTGEREVQRAKREAAISNVDLLAQEIYQARAQHPSVFAHWKQTHPAAIQRAEEHAGAPGSAGGTGGGGGTSSGGSQNKRRRKH